LLKPFSEESMLQTFHPMAGIEHGAHCVEKIFIDLKILFVLDQVEFELLLDELILNSFVAIQILNQVVEQIV